MVMKAGGVWEVAEHLGHISLLCLCWMGETVEAQLVYSPIFGGLWRATKRMMKIQYLKVRARLCVSACLRAETWGDASVFSLFVCLLSVAVAGVWQSSRLPGFDVMRWTTRAKAPVFT